MKNIGTNDLREEFLKFFESKRSLKNEELFFQFLRMIKVYY